MGAYYIVIIITLTFIPPDRYKGVWLTNPPVW